MKLFYAQNAFVMETFPYCSLTMTFEKFQLMIDYNQERKKK